MPIYEYQCGLCEKIHEVTVGSPSDAPDELPCVDACGGSMKRIISNTSFILKGSGWAKDGYGNKK